MSVPCPNCQMAVAEAARACSSCGRGIAVVVLRGEINGTPRRFEQRVSCEPDEVEFLDGLEATIDNPEDLPGREA